MRKDCGKQQKNIFILVVGILVIIACAIGLARSRVGFVETLLDLMGETESLPLLTKIFIEMPSWLHLVISGIFPLLLLLTAVFWKGKYKHALLIWFMVLTALYIYFYWIALYLPLAPM